MTSPDKNKILRNLPGVDSLLNITETDTRFNGFPKKVVIESLRQSIAGVRQSIIDGQEIKINEELFLSRANALANDKLSPNLFNVINATGVVLHTNMGRALLCAGALDNIQDIARSYSNLELNIKTGKRGIRYQAVEELICELTGAQSAIAVNNNAGAVLLALNTVTMGKEAIVSRGELVEIGGSFRVPDVMSKSGGILKEVGTTNRTHLRDYEGAISDNTGLFLKVHTSNYKIQGFTADVSLQELVDLGKGKNIPVMEDLGSGTLIDFSNYGLPAEPTIADSVKTGADIVTFSGDKLLGGPQAGIIVGKKEAVDKIKSNPLTRALRIDKLTLAALEATLKLYLDEKKAVQTIPTLRMLTMPLDDIKVKAMNLFNAVQNAIKTDAAIDLADMSSRPGGGSFPELELPTCCVTITPRNISVSQLEKRMRASNPPVIGRIEDNKYILDPRTILEGQEDIISATLKQVLN